MSIADDLTEEKHEVEELIETIQNFAGNLHCNSEDDSHEDNFRGCTNQICIDIKGSIRILAKELAELASE